MLVQRIATLAVAGTLFAAGHGLAAEKAKEFESSALPPSRNSPASPRRTRA